MAFIRVYKLSAPCRLSNSILQADTGLEFDAAIGTGHCSWIKTIAETVIISDSLDCAVGCTVLGESCRNCGCTVKADICAERRRFRLHADMASPRHRKILVPSKKYFLSTPTQSLYHIYPALPFFRHGNERHSARYATARRGPQDSQPELRAVQQSCRRNERARKGRAH